ncbi:MAG: endonuclease/exonuclease/phosphatase family protein [Rhizobiaceae bacterium]|nr:endonuclease/exonuclease/phosphatase family protein [Rhizobiaceae bacterium]
MISAILLGTVTAILLAATFLSFLRIAHGFVRSFAFPRLQILVVTLVTIPLVVVLVGPPVASSTVRAAMIVALLLVAVTQILCILPFTPLWKRQSRSFEGSADDPSAVSILSYNVKMSNRHYAEALGIAESRDPDIAVFMETDQSWCDALMPMAKTRPHILSAPYDNAYGMILFSRLPLSDTSIDVLVMDEVPSFAMTVTLRDGQCFRFHAVHPEPPVPYADSAGRDAELLKVADIVARERLPSVVSGDLNDVAWSHTTRLFQRVSRLLDPRIGRGFYNTFDARFFFMRWPLDHLFHDARFAMIDMERLPAGGSDHFPMVFRLALTGTANGSDLPEEEDAADEAEKKEIIAEGEALERDAIGVDWEK